MTAQLPQDNARRRSPDNTMPTGRFGGSEFQRDSLMLRCSRLKRVARGRRLLSVIGAPRCSSRERRRGCVRGSVPISRNDLRSGTVIESTSKLCIDEKQVVMAFPSCLKSISGA